MCPKLILVSLFIVISICGCICGTQADEPPRFGLNSGKWCSPVDLDQKFDVPQKCGTINFYEKETESFSFWAASKPSEETKPWYSKIYEKFFGQPIPLMEYFARTDLGNRKSKDILESAYENVRSHAYNTLLLKWNKTEGNLSIAKDGWGIDFYVIKNGILSEPKGNANEMSSFRLLNLFRNGMITPTRWLSSKMSWDIEMRHNDIIITFTRQFLSVPHSLIIETINSILALQRAESPSNIEESNTIAETLAKNLGRLAFPNMIKGEELLLFVHMVVDLQDSQTA